MNYRSGNRHKEPQKVATNGLLVEQIVKTGAKTYIVLDCHMLISLTVLCDRIGETLLETIYIIERNKSAYQEQKKRLKSLLPRLVNRNGVQVQVEHVFHECIFDYIACHDICIDAVVYLDTDRFMSSWTEEFGNNLKSALYVATTPSTRTGGTRGYLMNDLVRNINGCMASIGFFIHQAAVYRRDNGGRRHVQMYTVCFGRVQCARPEVMDLRYEVTWKLDPQRGQFYLLKSEVEQQLSKQLHYVMKSPRKDSCQSQLAVSVRSRRIRRVGNRLAGWVPHSGRNARKHSRELARLSSSRGWMDAH